jgi:tRNA A-37 threonylcarbamoyl transferase component Bud32
MQESADAAPLVPGQVLESKYRISKMLGGGAMGIVYEAYHLLLQKSVAIKVLRPELAQVEDLRDRFEAEARAAAAIGHPNIITVTDMGQTPEGALYFVMDRLRGETLGERLEKQGKLEVAAAVRIMLEVLAGLEAAHELRLVHRDLKPDNIFLARPPGGREIAKILDFGIAKALASVGRRSKGTHVGTTVGTPMYMAPEQALADPNIDARADLYSLGVILYQSLAGRPPFDGNNAVDVLAAVMMETPLPLGSLCREAPFELVQLVEMAMSRDRERRPSTAGEMITRLQEVVAQVRPAPGAKGNTAYDASGLTSLDNAVLVDLTGKLVPEVSVPAALTVVDDLFQQPAGGARAPDHGDEHRAEKPTLRDTSTLPADEQAPWPPPRPRARRWPWLLPIPVLVAAAALLVPRLGSRPEIAVNHPPARPTALVQFDLAGAQSQLFLDGSPLPSNPIALGTGEFHTVTAVAGGRVVGTEKFLVDQPRKTVRVRVGRK